MTKKVNTVRDKEWLRKFLFICLFFRIHNDVKLITIQNDGELISSSVGDKLLAYSFGIQIHGERIRSLVHNEE